MTERSDENKACVAGDDDYVTRPHSLRRLLATINEPLH
jgi:DNA-binding response OmpR family regulator